MELSTRRLTVSVVLVALLASAGCLGFVSGQNALNFSAHKATVSQSAQQQAGFKHVKTRQVSINKTVTVAGNSRQVNVTNWASVYAQSASLGGTKHVVGGFAVVSTPQVKIAGQAANPLAHLSNKQLVERLISRVSQRTSFGNKIQNVHVVGHSQVTILGKQTQMTKFSATVHTNHGTMNVYLHVAKVQHGGDIVIAAGVYPQQLPSDQKTIRTLAQHVQHNSTVSTN